MSILSAAPLVLAMISFVLTIIWGRPLIQALKWLKMGDSIRLEMPDRHLEKVGTPTMGGVMFIIPTILLSILTGFVSLLNFDESGKATIILILSLVVFAALGAIDDWEKLRNKALGEGMRARTKFLIQLLLAFGIVCYLKFVMNIPDLRLPISGIEFNLGIWYFPIAILIITGFANAVNFTDGLDGLAGTIAATCFAAFGVIALNMDMISLAQFTFLLVGALFGYLWFNAHPAHLIMGDTGSMALGATLGVVALMTGYWLLLPLIAIIPVSEVLSVILQVGYFKLTGGKRIFKMSPIHLHFELSGWSETQIVQRFWLITLLFAMVGVALAGVL